MVVLTRVIATVFLYFPLLNCCGDGAPQPGDPVSWQTVRDPYGVRPGCRGFEYYRPAYERVEWEQAE